MKPCPICNKPATGIASWMDTSCTGTSYLCQSCGHEFDEVDTTTVVYSDIGMVGIPKHSDTIKNLGKL